MGRSRGRIIDGSSLRSSIQQRQQPGFTERPLGGTLAGAASHRQVSALFRPRPNWEAGLRPDSPALRPLHSLPLRWTQADTLYFISFRRPQTGETADAVIRARPTKTNGREASPGQDQHYGRDASHVAQDESKQ